MNCDTITPKELAKILNKSEATVRSDVHRAPERLPPRIVIPGSSKLLWRKASVVAWLASHEQAFS